MATLNVESVLSKLSQKEKVDLLSGGSFWHTKSLPKHGIPGLRLSDGPNGIRGQTFFAGTRGAVLPCGTALGATWDRELLVRAGKLMGTEAVAKGVHVVLGPTINIQRGPLGGRGFESISEDPVLSGLAAASLIEGIQANGVVACLKHFVCNDQEHERNRVDVRITQRALREIYLLPFMLAIKGGKPGSMMSSYNKINGLHVSESKELLTDVLRAEWGWKGLIMSDWFGTYSTSTAIRAGLDLEMPGPSRFRGNSLGHAITTNKVGKHVIDERVREMLKLVNRCAASGIPEDAPELEIDSPEIRALLRELAVSSIVLLKNENKILPFSKTKSTVVIGPNAIIATICGGGSASLPSYNATTPYEGIQAALGTKVPFTVGAYSHKELPILGLQVKTAEGEDGMSFSVYNEPPSSFERHRVDRKVITKTDAMLMDYKVPTNTSGLWYADIEGRFTPEISGEYELGLCVYGQGQLFVDGKLVVDNSTKQRQGTAFFGCGTVEEKGVISVKQGQTYHIKVEYSSAPTNTLGSGGVVRFGGGGFRIGGAFVIDPEAEIESAVNLAQGANQVIICAGLNADWETEGSDRQHMSLPGHLDEMISRVARANTNTTVILQAGTPVSMPWINDVSAVAWAWYGGNEAGHAIADIIFGAVNPSGKTSLSFPKVLEDNPTFLSFKSERGRTLYGEDIYVGYRYYESVRREVLFPFGHGLSYTTFSFSNLKIDHNEQLGNIKVSVVVENTGLIAGAEVVQVYVAQRNPSIGRPKKELKGFTKLHLQPGEKNTGVVEIETKYATSFWDEERDMWVSEEDIYDVLVANTSAASGQILSGSFDITSTTWWKGL
ncbi:glycoside hydrolase superfamily [Cadophora sp. MPI-SDFR-AT-0126]|nr:glycoside hydrolase superfamily [Leotiomycetes sp. MPI-SDFR-AT-0126]